MTKKSTRSPLTLLTAVALLLLLVPLWFWNERVARLPLGLSLQLMPGQLIASRGSVHNWENSWFDGGSSQRAWFSSTAMTIDLQTGQWTIGQQPLVIIQNSQRFTFEEVPSMNGYTVHIEDLTGVRPKRELKVNVSGRPVLVNARYLVWTRQGFYEVVDLSVDASELTVLETEQLVAKHEFPLKSIPGTNCFYGFSRWSPNGTQLCLFKIESGRVVSLGEWTINGLEVGLHGRELLTHSADHTIQIHSVDDGSLIGEVPNPFDLLTTGRFCGRLLMKLGSTVCFDVKTQREINAPFKIREPHTMNDSVAVFLSAHNVHPSRLWVYDFEKGRERFDIVLPATVHQASIEGDHLVVAGPAHTITAYTIDLANGKIRRTLQPYGITSRSAGLLVFCFGFWCVAWLWLQPTGRLWVDLAIVLAVLLFGLRPYQSYPQTMFILLVASGFALWYACLSPRELMNGVSRALFLGASGLFFLPEDPLRSRYLWLLGFWCLLVLLLHVSFPWWLGLRLINKRSSSYRASRMSIWHLLCLMTIAAVLVVGWPGIQWVWMAAGTEAYLILAVASSGCLLGLTGWLGLWQRRWWSSGWLDAMVAVSLLGLVVVPRLFLLWYGYSIFEGLDVSIWSTWSNFLAEDSSYPLEILWESAAVCLIGPYLLAVVLRYRGITLQKPPETAPLMPDSGQVLISTCE